jgi:hypothetical protein
MVLTTTDVLKVLCKEQSLELLRIVALTKPDTTSANIIKTETNTKLTRKQYYSRMSSLMKAGLIKRKQGKYALTAFGKVVYDIVQIKLENAVNNYWNLQAIDSLEGSNELSAEERKKLIDNLIDNHEIKAILLSDIEKENKNNKLEYDQPLPNTEQKQSRTAKCESNNNKSSILIHLLIWLNWTSFSVLSSKLHYNTNEKVASRVALMIYLLKCHYGEVDEAVDSALGMNLHRILLKGLIITNQALLTIFASNILL